MDIEFCMWVIVTKHFPIMFGTESGELTGNIKDALFHSQLSSAKQELGKYDVVSDFEIRKLKFSCEL